MFDGLDFAVVAVCCLITACHIRTIPEDPINRELLQGLVQCKQEWSEGGVAHLNQARWRTAFDARSQSAECASSIHGSQNTKDKTLSV